MKYGNFFSRIFNTTILQQVNYENRLYRKHKNIQARIAREKSKQEKDKIERWKKEGTYMKDELAKLTRGLIKKIPGNEGFPR